MWRSRVIKWVKRETTRWKDFFKKQVHDWSIWVSLLVRQTVLHWKFYKLTIFFFLPSIKKLPKWIICLFNPIKNALTKHNHLRLSSIKTNTVPPTFPALNSGCAGWWWQKPRSSGLRSRLRDCGTRPSPHWSMSFDHLNALGLIC